MVPYRTHAAKRCVNGIVVIGRAKERPGENVTACPVHFLSSVNIPPLGQSGTMCACFIFTCAR
jgi:hypothetical protein